MADRRPPPHAAGVVLLLAAALCVVSTACSAGSGSGAGGSGMPVHVRVTERDGAVSATPDLAKAHTGQPIVITVSSDAVDEIDVQSVPGHELRVRPGRDQTFTFSVATPGTVEVESHGLDQTILKLQIS